MPLTLNNCARHGGHVEDDCPACVQEAYSNAISASREFFQNYGRCKIELIPGKIVRVEDLFQHFRMRILEELNGG
jgi:hypothetical protein